MLKATTFLIALVLLIASSSAIAMPLCSWLLESNKPLISQKDFFRSRNFDRYGMLSKDESLSEQINQLPINPQLKEHLVALGNYNHLTGHYTRLLRDGEGTVEGMFAVALQENEDLIPRDNSSASHVILIEGFDTALWWTFAPYILYLLKERGLGNRNSIGQVICWAGTAKIDSDDVSLEGLRSFPNSYILNVDQEHMTHRFTYQEAKRVISLSSCFE